MGQLGQRGQVEHVWRWSLNEVVWQSGTRTEIELVLERRGGRQLFLLHLLSTSPLALQLLER